MAGIRLDGIRKSFGDTPVLGGIDLDIADGEFLTLVGPSGCGKSTLLRIIAGLEGQDAGDVTIGDRLVNAVRPAERNLAMVFQSYALYPHLTVAQNMAVPLKLRELSFAERLPLIGPLMARQKYRALMDQVAETAEVLKIEALLARKPGQLSGGQRQRAALGRAMVRQPVAFLMDEPLSNLDAALRVHMRAELAELHRALDATFIYVTHDQSEALTMSDRMAVMMGGEILQLDRPATIYDDPQDLRVAEFIGSPKINTLKGEIAEDGRVIAEGFTLQRRLQGHSGPVSVGLRPEHLVVQDTAYEGSFTGQVVHAENLGSDIYLHLDIGSARLVVRTDPARAAETGIGATVHCAPLAGKAMVFGADNARLRFPEDAAEPEAKVA